jgi:hypothetical protein
VSVASHKQGFGGNAMRANHISEGDHLVAINDQPVEGWSLSAIRARLGISRQHCKYCYKYTLQIVYRTLCPCTVHCVPHTSHLAHRVQHTLIHPPLIV